MYNKKKKIKHKTLKIFCLLIGMIVTAENKIMTQNLLKKLALLKIDVKKFHCYNSKITRSRMQNRDRKK